MKKVLLIRKAISILFLYFLFYSCVIDKFDTKFKIVNRTNETVFIDILKSDNDLLKNPVIFDGIKKDTLWEYMRWIPAQDSISLAPPFGSWENFIENECKDKILTIVFYKESILKSYPKDTMLKEQTYSRKENLRIEDLEKHNWTIVFE